MESAHCSVSWLKCQPCGGIEEVTNDGVAYDIAHIDQAPWYDPRDPATARFLGVTGITVENLPGATREGEVKELITDGGAVGRVRNASRRVRIEAMLSAQGEDALEAGFSWLDAALRPGHCNTNHTHGPGCGPHEDMLFYNACLPTRESVTTPSTVWNDPITNLATNPSFETAGAATTVRTNLATNPSFEATTAATVEVRRNLNTNPAMVNLATGWTGANGGVITATATGNQVDFAGGTALGLPFFYQSSTITAVPGEAFTGSYEVTVPVGQPAVTLYASIVSYGGASDGRAGSWVTINPGETKRVLSGVQPSAPAGTTGIRVVLYPAIAIPAGQQLVVAKAQTEKSAAVGTYFDGSTLPASDFTHAWTGTANASASVQYGLQVPSVSGATALVMQSTEWASSGAKSLRTRPTNAAIVAQGHAQVFTWDSSHAGKTYTAIVKVRLATPMTTINATCRSLFSTSNISNQQGPQAPNVAGVTELRWTFTVPVGTTSGTLRLYHGGVVAAGDPDVWWDDFLLVEGAYTGPYFDGSTPAKVRRNLVTNPLNDGVVNSHVTAARATISAGTGYVRATVTDATVGVNNQRLQSGAPARPLQAVTPGQTVTLSAKGRASANFLLSVQLQFLNSVGGLVSLVQGADTAVSASTFTPLAPLATTVPAGASQAHWIIGIGSGARAVNDTFDITDVLLEVAPTALPFFDGTTAIAPYAAAWEGAANASPSYLTDPDFTYAWTGTANASTSVQRGVGVAGVTGGIQSTEWASDRTHSLRVPQGQTATISVPADSTVVLTARAVGQLLNGVAITSTDVRLMPFGGTLTLGEGWWDGLAIVAGQYGAPYFDGFTPNTPPSTVEGATLNEYAWTGTPDASTSTNRTGIVVYVPDEEAWQEEVDRLTRYMHTVTCVSGPTIVDQFHRGDSWGYLVEFVLVSAVPWVHGVTRFLSTNPTVPVVVQDVPFNLVPYPSAEVALGTVVASTNYSTNPSVELNLTTWAAGSSGAVVAGNVVQSTSDTAAGGIASVGTKSVRERLTATNTSAAVGTVRAENTSATFPAAVAGSRMSVNMWVNAQVASGTAVLTNAEVYVVWRTGTTVLQTDLVGAMPAGGGAVSKKSMPVPVGADNAIIRAQANLASWSTGAIVDLFADAVAITIP